MSTFVCSETTSETDDESVFVEVFYCIDNQRRTFLTTLHVFNDLYFEIFCKTTFQVFLDIPYCLVSENALIIGFARRFATYKRAHLLFNNIERLAELLNNPEKPVVFLFAGKAHPNDKAGQDLIKMIIETSRKKEFAGKVIFLNNYDMELGKILTSSVDIWMNTPTRPLEASGTSGEKAVMNGTLNLSVLDGWWAEGLPT